MAATSIPKRTLLLGRSSECDVILNHPEVSGRHALLTILPDGKVEVRDVGSTNGTFINGQRVMTGILQTGDKLTLGTYAVDWEEILKNPPPPTSGSGSATRITRIRYSSKGLPQTFLWVAVAILVVLGILWFFVRPWVFQPK
ncbi:MAG: FHA domain-containing protein [Bacteroidia bacterium]|nr:FHA domain-containing protein [Bacteroidia bacterium]MDW8014674.1 FHA domain-containing protein [Bacteroidia bacterium]